MSEEPQQTRKASAMSAPPPTIAAAPRIATTSDLPRLAETGLAAPAQRLAARTAKRTLDVLASALALVVLSPLIALISIAIRLDSPGPVLFTQRRIGRGGRPFNMLKFRTMIDGADDHKNEVLHLNEIDGGMFKISADPRLTRFGAFLRSTSLDELPQLVDVLRGQMSLVGPRPLIPEEDALIRGAYRQRSDARPGMTGPWQVAGASRVPLDQMVELDCDYVEGWTIWGDAKLIVKTLPHVVLRRGI
jgi:lipopolysaccharide/colanic/teichoic acid biosynthesis glycosyltransferase